MKQYVQWSGIHDPLNYPKAPIRAPQILSAKMSANTPPDRSEMLFWSRYSLPMQIGDKIRKAREHKNLSRSYLAEVLQMDVRTFERIENNQRDLHLKEAAQLAQALDLTPEILLFGEPKLIFERRPSSNSTDASGTAVPPTLSEVKALYESVIARLEKVIADKDVLIENLHHQLLKKA
ncbi:MAG: XRE family transcriptional regulator [Sphingobacteriales bacterium]|nr:MAG: XRE family transcriptional regulator [Sphingobacteriales bacterium]